MIKKCPFCGGNASVVQDCITGIYSKEFLDDDRTLYVVECDSCHAQSQDFTNSEDAIKYWNRRADVRGYMINDDVSKSLKSIANDIHTIMRKMK